MSIQAAKIGHMDVADGLIIQQSCMYSMMRGINFDRLSLSMGRALTRSCDWGQREFENLEDNMYTREIT
jgi:hypothetical protein